MVIYICILSNEATSRLYPYASCDFQIGNNGSLLVDISLLLHDLQISFLSECKNATPLGKKCLNSL
jgi:hypothetical protein